MTIRNRLLVLLLAIALTPLILTSALQQMSIRVARNRLASRTREALDANARLALLEQLGSHVEILERERQLADALLARQAREVELRLASLTPPVEPNRVEGFFGPRDGRPQPMADARPPGEERGRRVQENNLIRRPPAVEIVSSDYRFGFDPNIESQPAQRHAYFTESGEPNTFLLQADY